MGQDKSKTMANRPDHAPAPLRSERGEIDTFLERARASVAVRGTRGRLIFALDATQSRQPTWDAACELQAEMFQEVAGRLDVQLVHYRGVRECQASRWVSDGRTLASLMSTIECQTGHTQIGKVLAHVRRENERQKVSTLVFVGDAMEEKLDDLCHAAGLLGVPAFIFQEGDDPTAERAFREIARLTHGAYCHFDLGAAHQLTELLRTAAAYAAGGVHALSTSRNADFVKLLQQLK